MIADYLESDPYLGLGIAAKVAPKGATPKTHGPLRERLKPMTLAVQYGGAGGLIAHRLGIDRQAGDRFVDLHHEHTPDIGNGRDRKLYRAYDEGVLIARDGWQCGVSSQNARIHRAKLADPGEFGQQSSATAGLMARKLGIEICGVVHDALLIEAPADRIEEEAAGRPCASNAPRACTCTG